MPKRPHGSIRLNSLDITIRLKRGSYTLDAAYRFLNNGGIATEWVGLPYFGWGYEETSPDGHKLLQVHAWVDGRKVKFARERDVSGIGEPFPKKLPPDSQSKISYSWWVGLITFAAHAKQTVRIRYEAPYIRYEKDEYTEGSATFLSGSACNWKGNITRILFTIDCTKVGGTKNVSIKCSRVGPYPGPRSISDKVYTYEVKDFKPYVREELVVELSMPQQGK